ncbi:preprotein translocase subunit SecG [Aminicella lysinilytica]|uniref:Protein-export membrane protein SecG n=1 Tax=Aminicella lysinilytica TaxID=433323 RepID=A0A4R6Q6J0_9FIRM|nr:preprotein translocase subunit SecG [Aminicella lysinilytica]TDP58084.1 protein translocase subunit secG [Aminicella lysinilytica]
MYTAMMVVLAIVSALMILVILMQSSNSDGLSGSIAGGAEQLFGKKKSRGYEAILNRITIVLSVVFIVLSLVLVTLGK